MRRVGRASAIGRRIALASACLLLAGTARAATEVVWSGADGVAFRVAIPDAEWRIFTAERVARLAEEEQRLRALVDAMVALEVADAFRRVGERLPAYTDWVYGWLESYVATYMVAERAAELWLGMARDRPAMPLRDAVNEGLNEIVTARFDSLVLRPSAIDQALDGAVARTGTTIAAEWRRVVERDRRAFDELVVRHATAARPAVAGDAVCTISPDLPGLNGHQAAGSDRLQPDQSDLFALRFARPYAARVVIITSRVLSGGGLLASAGAFGLGLGGGPVAATITATAMIWSLDYMVNRIDAASHRGEFEERLVKAIAEAEHDIAGDLRTRASALIGDAYKRAARCPAVASGRS
ncbi:MAG: hypothetical protein AB7O45_14990 [Alphaproteobacteria bacterium]